MFALILAAWYYPQMHCEIHQLGILQDETRRAGMYAAHPGKVEELPASIEFRRKTAEGYETIRRDARFHSAVGLRSDKTGWEAKAFDGAWRPCSVYPDAEVPPHLQRVSEDRSYADLTFKDGIYDTRRELLAYVECSCAIDPKIDYGESLTELANEDPVKKEYVPMMRCVGERRWRSDTAMALRYFKFAAPHVTDVKVVPVWKTHAYTATFSSPNPRWNAMREVGVHTLRLCDQEFLLDGVKRDRLPWAGDLAVSLLADAYVYGDADTIRKSLSIMDAYATDVNNIVTYSMWAIIAHDLYQLYFGDRAFLESRWWRIKGRIDNLISRTNARGFVTQDLRWVFVDWVPSVDEAAMQMIWVGALDAAARLADRMGDKAAGDYRSLAAKIRHELNATSWNAKTGMYGKGRHASIYAVIFDVADTDKTQRIADNLIKDEIPAVGTPYVYGWELVAINRAGHHAAFLAGLEKVFGAMLDAGATSFWEGYDAKERGADRYAFYGRPFAKSLCHVWSAWPAFIFVSEALGVKPTSDGWKTWTKNPIPEAKGIHATIPTPNGIIEI